MKKLMLSSVVMLSLTSYPVVAAIPRKDVEGFLIEEKVFVAYWAPASVVPTLMKYDEKQWEEFKANAKALFPSVSTLDRGSIIQTLINAGPKGMKALVEIETSLRGSIKNMDRAEVLNVLQEVVSGKRAAFAEEINKIAGYDTGSFIKTGVFLKAVKALKKVEEKDQNDFVTAVRVLVPHIEANNQHGRDFERYLEESTPDMERIRTLAIYILPRAFEPGVFEESHKAGGIRRKIAALLPPNPFKKKTVVIAKAPELVAPSSTGKRAKKPFAGETPSSAKRMRPMRLGESCAGAGCE